MSQIDARFMFIVGVITITILLIIGGIVWLTSKAPHCEIGTPLYKYVNSGEMGGYHFVGCELP